MVYVFRTVAVAVMTLIYWDIILDKIVVVVQMDGMVPSAISLHLRLFYLQMKDISLLENCPESNQTQ
jgi:hypothetical protein